MTSLEVFRVAGAPSNRRWVGSLWVTAVSR